MRTRQYRTVVPLPQKFTLHSIAMGFLSFLLLFLLVLSSANIITCWQCREFVHNFRLTKVVFLITRFVLEIEFQGIRSICVVSLVLVEPIVILEDRSAQLPTTLNVDASSRSISNKLTSTSLKTSSSTAIVIAILHRLRSIISA